jgi:hypothetical protein
METTILLVFCLIFPTISWLTLVLSWWTKRRTKRNCSAVLVPYVGPVLLTCWVVQTQRSMWLIPVVWLLDAGTLIFSLVLPRLVAEWWRVSSFTRILVLRGLHEGAKATLSFHSSGYYLLQKEWKLDSRPVAHPIDLSVVGKYETTENGYCLCEPLHSLVRKTNAEEYCVEEEHPTPEALDASLHGWTLQRKK